MDFTSLLKGSEETVKAIVSLLTGGVGVLLGALFIFSGFRKMIEHSHGQRHGQPTAGPVAINLLIGSLLAQMGFTIDTLIIETMFGEAKEAPSAAMNYMPNQMQESQMMVTLINAALWWVASQRQPAVTRQRLCSQGGFTHAKIRLKERGGTDS